MKQHTIAKTVDLQGVGLHTGAMVRLQFHPAEEGHGIRFRRVDLEGQPIVKADVSQVISTNRGTTLKNGEAVVHTIEHVLSAVQGLRIDNLLIDLDGPEAPIMDGSSLPILNVLQQAGMVEQDAEREYFEVTETIKYRDEATGTELMALPSDTFHVTTLIDFESPVLGHQYASMNSLDEYAEKIAPCRTFVFLHELEQLLDQGLIRGGDLNNAVVIVDRIISEEDRQRLADRLGKQDIRVEKTGVLNTTELRSENEPARHKLLDIIGDLTLLGRPIKGRIVAYKPGHTANVEFAKLLKTEYLKQRKLKGLPRYDPDTPPIYDVEGISKFLPHRYPFLLVDKIIELSDTHVVGLKNLTFNEALFQGHFPNNPVFPGVLQIEAMAQTGGILALSSQEDPHNWDTYFLKIDNAKFKAKVGPGDTILFKLVLTAPIRRGIVQMRATAYVGSKVVSEGDLTAQIVKREA